MICKSCGVAGDLIAIARKQKFKKSLTVRVRFDDNKVAKARFEQWENVPTEEAVRSVAMLYHGICSGRTHCDCQHFIDFEGRLINAQGQESGETPV